MEDSPFYGLNYLIQYRRKDECVWHNMAAFDGELAAERYFTKQGGDDSPWEYRMVEVPEGSRP